MPEVLRDAKGTMKSQAEMAKDHMMYGGRWIIDSFLDWHMGLTIWDALEA